MTKDKANKEKNKANQTKEQEKDENNNTNSNLESHYIEENKEEEPKKLEENTNKTNSDDSISRNEEERSLDSRNPNNTKHTGKLLMFTFNFFLIILGISLGFLGFSFVRYNQIKHEREQIIPDAKVAIDNEEYSKAINLLIDAEDIYPDNQEVKRLLAELYDRKNKYQESIKYYEDIKNLDSEETNRLGELYLIQNETQKLIELWEGSDITPKNRFLLAEIYYDKDDLDNYLSNLRIIESYKQAKYLLQVDNQNPDNLYASIKEASELEEIDLPDDVDKKYNWDEFVRLMGESQKEYEYNKTDFAQLIRISAFTQVHQCKFLEDEIKQLRTSLEQSNFPTFQLDFYNGVCLNQEEKPEEAIKMIQKAIEADPNTLQYRNELAKSYYLNKDVENLVSTYKEIVTISSDKDKYMNLAYYLLDLNNFEKAKKYFSVVMESTKDKNLKTESAIEILRIELLENQNISACTTPQLIKNITPKEADSQYIEDQILILEHCNLYNNRNVNKYEDYPLFNDYFYYLNTGDKNQVNNILDRDLSGKLILYYNKVGSKLIED